MAISTQSRASLIVLAALLLSPCPPASAQPASNPTGAIAADDRPHATPKQKAKAKKLAAVLAYTSVLLLIFVIGSWAIVRFSRRFQNYLVRGDKAPTQSDDVWAMHRLPPDAMEQLDEDDPA